jgi:aquaporin Z
MGEPDSEVTRLRRLVAELVGTFALTFAAAGGEVVARVTGAPAPAWRLVAPGLVVMSMIYTFGPLSGAHLNPAVTLAFTLRGNFPWLRMPGYLAAQLLGAILAGAVLRAMFGDVALLGGNRPHHGLGISLGMEIILTFLLVTVILATAANFKIVGHNAALAVGGTIIFAGLVGGPISGASMNPARSLGPAIIAGNLDFQWIYIAGPAVGSAIAVALAWVLRGPGTRAGQGVAVGDLPN